MSYKVGKPEGLNFSESENDKDSEDGSPRRSRRRQTRRSPRKVKSPDPDHPSWGFGASRAASRQRRSISRTSSRARSRGSSRATSRLDDLHSSAGLSYEEVVKTSSAGNTLMPKGMKRQQSRASLRSNVSSRWKDDLETFKAIKITFYKNGDKWFEGFDFRFRPLKDYVDLESLLERISGRIDFNSPVTHLFDTDGNQVEKVDDLEDRHAYVASNSRRFKPGNYGKLGDKFVIKKKKSRMNQSLPRSGSSTPSSATSKPSSANSKVIKIVNHDDPTLSEKVLLNLKTSQTFEEVVEDLGQVLKIRGADRMYTVDGLEVRSFSHLRTDFSNHEVFLITAGPTEISQYVRDLLSNDDNHDNSSLASSRSGERASKGTIEVKINGARKIYYPPQDVRSCEDAPDGNLGLQWVFGYRGADRQGNLLVLQQGELVYFLGTVVVVYDQASERQRHYKGHTQDVACMALHPGGDLVVSGQEQGDQGDEVDEGPCCRVWNVYTMETQAVIEGRNYGGGIAGVSFSVPNDGEFLVTVSSRSDESVLSVWEWTSSTRLGEVTMDMSGVSGVTFHPFDSNLLITYGSGGHLTFWNRKKDGFFARADVGEEEDNMLLTYTCVNFLESGDLVVGDSEGEVSVFTVSRDGEYYKSTAVQAHTCGVSALLPLGEGVLVSAGVDDGLLEGWDTMQDFNKLVEARLPARAGSGTALCKAGGESSTIYVGTSRNLVMAGRLQRRFKVVLFGHADQISSLTTHGPSTEGTFASGGTDRLVVLWHENRLVWKVLFPSEPSALAFSPEGNYLAVGTSDGFVVVLDAHTGVHTNTIKVCGSTISTIKFNADGEKLAAATNSGTIYLYKVVRDDFRSLGKLSGGLEITALDWEQKGDYIQTSRKDLNLQFWNTNTYKEEKVASLLKEKTWWESSCLVGWSVAGVWGNQNYANPTTTTTVHTSEGILATGDSDGYLRLFRHPCTCPKAKFLIERLFSDQVKVVRLLGDSQVVAAGGSQGSIFKFELIQN